jgi:hypothetical protein
MREGCKQLRAPCTFFPTAFSRSGAEDWLRPGLAGRAVRYTVSTGRYNMISRPRGRPVQLDFTRPSLLWRASTIIIRRCVVTVLSRTGTNGPPWLLLYPLVKATSKTWHSGTEYVTVLERLSAEGYFIYNS